jgi:hypothetical protein
MNPRPRVVKRNDDGTNRQIEKSVDERAGFTFVAYEDEELGPGPRLQDVRETMTPNRMMARISTDLSIRASRGFVDVIAAGYRV